MISVRTKICTENCKKAVKSSVSDFAAYVSEILGHFHLCLTGAAKQEKRKIPARIRQGCNRNRML